MCLSDRLANLHQLLRSSSFERWPLKLTFYAEDIFRVWHKVASPDHAKLGAGIDVIVGNSSQSATASDGAAKSATGIHTIEVEYNESKSHLEKSRGVDYSSSQCTLCSERLPADAAMSLVCPGVGCNAAGHLTCFASHFSTKDSDQIVPTSGSCPRCDSKLHWVDLVKELSLRMRGAKEINRMFKVRKPRATKKEDQSSAMVPNTKDIFEEDDGDDVPLDDNWHYLSDSTDAGIEDCEIRSDPNPLHKRFKQDEATAATTSEPIIDDSDWDDTEIVA